MKKYVAGSRLNSKFKYYASKERLDGVALSLGPKYNTVYRQLVEYYTEVFQDAIGASFSNLVPMVVNKEVPEYNPEYCDIYVGDNLNSDDEDVDWFREEMHDAISLSAIQQAARNCAKVLLNNFYDVEIPGQE